MTPDSSHPTLPPALTRFPGEVQAAFQRFRRTRELADLQLIVRAALRDFMPKRGNFPAGMALAPELRLVDDLGFDSLAVAETVFFFEDLFSVNIQTHEVIALHTIGDLESFVARKLAPVPVSA